MSRHIPSCVLAVMAGACAGLFPGATARSADPSSPAEPWLASRDNPPVVVCDAQASPPAAFARAELRRYLRQILGTGLPEPSLAWSGPIIRLAIREDPDLSDEAYELRGDGNVYHITGGGPLGLLYGTYEFLRRFGGCRFSDLGPDGEYVPRRGRLEAERGPLRMKPNLWYRGLQFSFREDSIASRQRIDWMAKNGFNYIMYHPAPAGGAPPSPTDAASPSTERRLTKEWFDRELLPEIRKRGLKLDMNHHNLLYWLPPDRYLAEHPDWYALYGGKRGGRLSQLCICTSTPDAVRTVIDNVKRYLRENPEVKIVGVIPEDGFGMCQCDACVAVDGDPKAAFRPDDARRENPSKSTRYHRLWRSVAEAVGCEFPGVLVGGAAYVDLLWPAPEVCLPANTTVWLALYWRDGCRPMDPGNTSALNMRFIDAIQRWKQKYPGRLLVYEYYMGMSAQSSLPYPMSEVICRDWPHLRKLGVEGATIQCWSMEHSVYALNNLAFARCAWEDQVDHGQVLDEYLLGAFGSAGEELRPVFQDMIGKVRQMAGGKGDLRPNADNVRSFVNEETKPAIQRALAAARRKAADDRERRQVEKLAAAVRYWELAAEILALSAQASGLRKSDRQAAHALLERATKTTWPALQSQMAALPPGWLGVRSPSRWENRIAALRALAAETDR